MEIENMTMEIGNMTMEFGNTGNICFSSKAIWLLPVVVLLAIPSLFHMVRFGCRWWCSGYFYPFRSRSPSPSPSPSRSWIKRKKKAERKKKLADNTSNTYVCVADFSQPLLKNMPNNKTESDASVDISQPLLEKTKISLVKVPRRFTYQSLVDATRNFLLERRMNIDYLGHVYKGQLVDTKEVFAIRRLRHCRYQGVKDFEKEVLLLSQANHPNLAKLIGYAVEGQNRLLVYEYVSGGSLENHLHGNKKCLNWNTRMKISQGVAKALGYLQNTMNPPIHHCYIQPSNIWLTEEYTPKLSAYGVVRMYPGINSDSIAVEMFGSYLYAMPDYRLTNNVTVQADIYGFGVFLLEIITGRKGFLKEDGVWLTEWVQPYLKDKKNLAEIVDPMLDGKFTTEEFYEAFKIAETCLEKQPDLRPLAVDLVTRINQLVTRNSDM